MAGVVRGRTGVDGKQEMCIRDRGGSGGSLVEEAVCVRTAGEVAVRGDDREAVDKAKGLDGPASE